MEYLDRPKEELIAEWISIRYDYYGGSKWVEVMEGGEWTTKQVLDHFYQSHPTLTR